jgi:hypothetical protein
MLWQARRGLITGNTAARSPVAGGTPFSIANTAFVSDTSSQTSYTFNTTAIGSADASRLVVIAAASRQAGSVGAASGVTVNGNAATLVVSGASTGTTNTVDIYQYALATGTTANIVITYPSAMARCGAGIYSVLGSNGVAPSGGAVATSLNNSGSSSVPISGSVTVPSGGGSIILGVISGTPISFTETNYTEDYDNAVATFQVTTGRDTGTSGSRTYTITQSTIGNQPCGAFAAWSP